ncbi:MAG: DUF1376 domain-containing protein [Negativicutes bacterium]
MQLYIGDYLGDTAHLTTLEHGAYMLLIMHYWQSGKPLPNSNGRLARVARMSNEEWTAVRDTLAEFFIDDGTNWIHKRIEKELNRFSAKSEQAKAAGIASAQRRLNGRSTDVEQTLNERSTDAQPYQIPDTRNQIPESETTTTPLPPNEEEKPEEEKETRVVVFEYLTKNICLVSNQVEADMIGDWIETMPRDWIIEAIKQAALSKARSIKYVDKILQAWVAKYKLDEKPWEVEADGGNRKNGLQVSHRRDPTADEYERDRSKVGWGD